jgi:hypothetical protein
LPAGEETLCPPRLTIAAFTLSTPHTMCGDGTVDTTFAIAYDGFGVACVLRNRYVYSSTDDACVRPYCSHRLWSEVCSTHRRYTQDLPHMQFRYITPSS